MVPNSDGSFLLHVRVPPQSSLTIPLPVPYPAHVPRTERFATIPPIGAGSIERQLARAEAVFVLEYHRLRALKKAIE